MIKKMMIAAALAASTLVAVPTAASANACMLDNGCFFVSGGGAYPGYWVCSDPAIYMLCLEP